jgi:hypothetical protein
MREDVLAFLGLWAEECPDGRDQDAIDALILVANLMRPAMLEDPETTSEVLAFVHGQIARVTPVQGLVSNV